MDEPGRSGDDGALRALAERLALALVGAAALTGERAQAVAEALVSGGGEASDRWRFDGARTRERAGATLAGVFRELGLVTRDELDELELRVAQLEHRLRLLESAPPSPPPARGIQL